MGGRFKCGTLWRAGLFAAIAGGESRGGGERGEHEDEDKGDSGPTARQP